MQVYKKVNKSGGVTIPRLIRNELGIVAGNAVEMTTDEKGLHIRKHIPACFHCGCVDEVIEHMGIEICRGCLGQMQEEMEKRYGKR